MLSFFKQDNIVCGRMGRNYNLVLIKITILHPFYFKAALINF